MGFPVWARRDALLLVCLGAFLALQVSLTAEAKAAEIGAAETKAAQKTVQGIGYPPIKSVTKIQALLMARRAAILDAYSKLVWRSGERAEESFFVHLSGFIRATKIISEELLPDGGVRVTMSLEPGMASHVSPPLERHTIRVNPILQRRQIGPKQVSQEEWFELISSMVTFDTNHLEEKTK